MSVRVMTAVWGLDLPDSEKIVLLALADCANDEGGCWPSMATLAKKCSKTDRTVQASIKGLVERGHLSRVEIPGKGCRYTVHPRSDFTPEVTSPPKPLPHTPEAASDKPSRTIIQEEEGSPALRLWACPEGVAAPHWRDFIVNRRRKNLAKTETAYLGQLKLLERFASDEWPPGRLVEKAAEKGWGTIVDPSEYETPRNGNHRPPNHSSQQPSPMLAGLQLLRAQQSG